MPFGGSPTLATAHRPDLKPGVVRRVIPWRAAPNALDPQRHEPPTAATDPTELCRQARKLRATYARQPAEMHRQLSRLTLAGGESRPDAGDVACSAERAYRRLVERTLRHEAPLVLRYSARLELLKQAARRGIGRFQANLIIASVEHELRAGQNAPSPRASSLSLASALLVFATVQSAILAGLWHLVR